MGLILFPRPLSPAIPRIGFNARRFLFFASGAMYGKRKEFLFFSLDQYKGEGGRQGHWMGKKRKEEEEEE